MNLKNSKAASVNLTALETLREHYLFAALDDELWSDIRRHVRERRLTDGERLFSQRETAAEFYVVCWGGIKLFRDSAEGLEKIMRLARPGQGFAESILFSDPPRYPVHAEAIGKTRVVAIQRTAYLSLLEASSDTCRAVMQQMVKRIYSHWDEIEMLTLHNSSARVARYLINLQNDADSGATILELPVRKVLIAAELGLAPETLSRAFRRLIDARAIEVDGPRVTILDSTALQHCALY